MSYIDFVKEVITTFNSNSVEYMIIGGGAALLQGFNMVTQDIDIYVKKDMENNKRVLDSVIQLGFTLSDIEKDNILEGKDFIQFDIPFELDLIFTPDGFDDYSEALKYKKYIQGIPVMSISGIIRSKKAANRKKDKLMLPLLIDFNRFLNRKDEIYNKDDYFRVIEGYSYADVQTLNRWKKNLNTNIWNLLEKGILNG